MNKIIIKPESINWTSAVYKNTVVMVNPFIGINDKTIFAKNYINALFQGGDIVSNFIEAESGIILGVIQLCTNVELPEDTNAELLDYFVSSGLWNIVKQNVKNFEDVKSEIYKIVEMKNLTESLPATLSTLFQKLSNLIDSVSDMDLSEDGIKKLMEALNVEKEKLNDIIPVIKNPVKRKPKKATV